MTEAIPTVQLRFVHRKAQKAVNGLYGPFMQDYDVRILQQAWSDNGNLVWRDVPCVQESSLKPSEKPHD